MLAGFPEGNVREIPSDDGVPDPAGRARRTRSRRDRAAGLRRLFRRRQRRHDEHGRRGRPRGARGASPRARGSGSTSTRRTAGSSSLTERGRRALRGHRARRLDRARPAQGPLPPLWQRAALLVRDRETLRRAHALSADYLPPMQEDADLADFNQHLARALARTGGACACGFRSKMHGIGPFRNEPRREARSRARGRGRELRAIPGIEILAGAAALDRGVPVAPGRAGPTPRRTRCNRDLLDRINGRKRVYLTANDAPRALRDPHLRPVLPDASRPHGGGNGGHPRRHRGAGVERNVKTLLLACGAAAFGAVAGIAQPVSVPPLSGPDRPAPFHAAEGLRGVPLVVEQSRSGVERRQQEADPGRDGDTRRPAGAGHRHAPLDHRRG